MSYERIVRSRDTFKKALGLTRSTSVGDVMRVRARQYENPTESVERSLYSAISENNQYRNVNPTYLSRSFIEPYTVPKGFPRRRHSDQQQQYVSTGRRSVKVVCGTREGPLPPSYADYERGIPVLYCPPCEYPPAEYPTNQKDYCETPSTSAPPTYVQEYENSSGVPYSTYAYRESFAADNDNQTSKNCKHPQESKDDDQNEAVQQQQQQQRHSAAVSPATSREYTQASAQQSAQAQRSFYNNTGTYQESQYESTVYADIPNFAQPYDGTVYAAIPDMMVQQYGNNVYADLPNLAQQRSFRERSPERQRSSFIDSYPRENNRQHQQLSQQQQQQQQQQQEQQQQQQQQQQRSTPCSRECSRSPSEQQQSYGESSHEQELSCTCDLTDERSVHNRRKQICKEASEKLKSFKRELEHELYVMEGEEFTEMDKSLKKWQKMRRKIMMKFLCVQFLRDLEKSGRSRSQSRPRQEDCPC